MGYSYHLAHQFYLAIGHTIVKTTAIAQNRVYEYDGTLLALLSAVVGHEIGLLVAEHQSCANGIEAEA